MPLHALERLRLRRASLQGQRGAERPGREGNSLEHKKIQTVLVRTDLRREPYSKKPSFWVKCQLYTYSVSLLRITQQYPSLSGRRKDEGALKHLGQKQNPLAGRKTAQGNCASTPFCTAEKVPLHPAGVRLRDLTHRAKEADIILMT